jgi:hypothetical protein
MFGVTFNEFRIESLCANTLSEIVRIDRGTHRTRKRKLFCSIVGAERCAPRSADEHEAQQLTKPNLQNDRGVFAFWFKLIVVPRELDCGRNQECI